MSTKANAKSSPDDRWFILVGINFYMPGTIRTEEDGSPMKAPNLYGCVSDVNRVERYLKNKLNVDDSRIIKLTSTAPDAGQASHEPQETAEKRATGENILRALRHVAQEASPEDLVLFYFSGHGARAKTVYRKLKGENGYDEGLVPCDIRCGGRFLRDVTLAGELHRMAERQLFVTVVLDSCHSGGATRESDNFAYRGLEKRFESVLDIDMRDQDNAFFSDETFFPGGVAKFEKPKARPESTWLLEPGRYELLTSCRFDEKSLELKDSAGNPQGALTLFLMTALESGGPSPTHGMLFRQLLAGMKSTGKLTGDSALKQTPVFAGNRKREFFGRDEAVDIHTIPVVTVNVRGIEFIYIQAGQAQGVTPDSEFLLYPWNATSFRKENATATVRVLKVKEFKSLVEFTGSVTLSVKELKSGCQAVLSKLHFDNKLKVKLNFSPTEKHYQSLLELLKQTSGLDQVSEDEVANYAVDVDKNGRLVLLDGSNQPIPNFPFSDNSESLIDRLIRLIKYERVRDLKSPSSASLDGKYIFELAEQKYPEADGTVIVASGEMIELKFENLSPGNLSVTVLNLQPLWGILQIYPWWEDGMDYGIAEAGEQRVDPPFRKLQMTIPPAASTKGPIVDVLKVFVTNNSTSFGFLEQPKLDPNAGFEAQPDRSGIDLEYFFEIFGKMDRDLSEQDAWATSEIKIRTVPGSAY